MCPNWFLQINLSNYLLLDRRLVWLGWGMLMPMACPVKYQKASCVFNLQALPANPNSQPPRGGPGAMYNGLCSK
jgi:hypothetical protein